MPILSSMLVLIGFSLSSCVGINLGDIPRLIPPHSVGKPYMNSPPSSIVTMPIVGKCNNTWGRRVRIGFSDRVWRDVPEVDPDKRGQKNPISTSTDESIGIGIAYGKSSHRVATPIRDTPRDDLSIWKSNGTYSAYSGSVLPTRSCQCWNNAPIIQT